MNKDFFKGVVYILIALIIGILAVKFIIWLFPVILIVIVSYIIYRIVKKKKVNIEVKKIKDKRKIKIIHDLDDED